MVRTNQWKVRLASLLFVCLFAPAAWPATADTPTAPAGEKAGRITALLPTAHVVRGEGKKAVTSDATRGEELLWLDVLRTDKGGRARITLNDQSILSLGSQAELRIVKHDAQSQQTSLEMVYGRIRAQVTTVTKDGGSFQVHTPTAVAGVIGTDFGTDASEPGVTTFVCISGVVQVGNSDPSVPGTVPCTAGQTTTVKSGLPPTPPKPVTQQQVNQLITDTEPATISAFAPASALIGTTLDAVATGTHMGGFNGVTITGSGVQASLAPNGSDTTATAHLVISATAPAGPRTVTFTKANGANTAAVFTVIAPPGLQGTDASSLKQRYTGILTAEQQSADASNASLKASVQQESDQGLQAIQQNNSRLPQPLVVNQISQQLGALVSSFNASGSNRESQAYSAASAAVDQIIAAVEPKIQNGSEPVANIASDLDKQFAPINQVFETALTQIHTDLVTQAATLVQSIDQLVTTFEQSITVASQQQLTPPTPKVDSDERSVEQGVQASFDASGSAAQTGASIVSTTWALCDPSYRPAQVGVLLPANPPTCKAIPGFGASSGQFQFNTCSLAPADYIARVTVIDSNGKTSAMDVRLHVNQPAYDDPATRLQNLASAYISLQPQQFLAFFDPVNYSGYTQLQENIRDTFLNLSSMQINVRVSQANVSCNDATLRADWDQVYTFKNDQSCVGQGSSCQKQLFNQHEQLTARMTRKPGDGWYITDFQGDNGKVQGSAPGPQTSFAPPSAGTVDLAVGNIASTNPYIETQANALDVILSNIGTAPSTASTGNLVVSVPDIPNLVLATADIPALPATGTATIHIPFTVPAVANLAGTHAVKVAISPPASGDSDAANDSANASLTFGVIDLVVRSVTPASALVASQTATLTVAVTNNGNVTSPAGTAVLNSPAFSGSSISATLPPIPPGATAQVPVQFTVPNAPGQQNVTVTLNSTGNVNTSTSTPTPVTIVSSGATYAITSILSTTTPNPPTGANAFQVGERVTLQIAVANTSTASPTGNITLQLSCAAPCQLGNSLTATIAAPAAGQSASAVITIPSLQLAPAAGYVANATITAAPSPSTTTGSSFTFDVTDFTLTNTLNLNGDLNVKLGGQGLFSVSLSEAQGLTPVSIPVVASPNVAGVSYVLNNSFAAGSSNQVTVLANGNAPSGTSTLVNITGTHLGVSRSATQSVRTYTASLENFSSGQPGSNQTQPIILPINGSPQSLSIRLSGTFFNPGGGAQLTFPTLTGISITPSATTAAAGDVVTLQVSATQGAAVNQTIPVTILAQIPNMNPPVPESLTLFVRPTALPDLTVTGVTVTGRNFSANPLLSGEPVNFLVTVANLGPGVSQGFEHLHLLLNGVELTNSGVTVPQALASQASTSVIVHVVAPDPVANGAATVTARVDEDAVGDLNPGNDALSVAISASDWGLAVNSAANGGNSDGNALPVTAGSSNPTSIQPVISGSGDFLTPVSVLNGVVSSRITATPSASSFTSSAQQIGYTISALNSAAQGFYEAQLIARFIDNGRPTAQRQATVHIQVVNAGISGDTVTVVSNRNNACVSGCSPIEINGLLIESAGLTPTRSGGSSGSVDLAFTDPASVVSNVTASGSPQSPIVRGVPYGVAANVFFAAGQDATGAVMPGPAQVTVSATAIQTSAMRDAVSPQAVGPNQTTLQFSVGDLQMSSQPCFNLAPGAEGVLQLTFTTLGGFNVPSISWSLASLPPGVVLNNLTPTSTFNGSSYTPVSIDLTNTNPTDILSTQALTLLGTISNSNGSANIAFAPPIQLHSGVCSAMMRKAPVGGEIISGTRGVWRRGSASGSIARSTMAPALRSPSADVRLIAGDVSYTPAMPKAGDTVQIRFRITNLSSIDASAVPISLLVNGSIVATDTFDVKAGRTTLGGLQWTNAQLPRNVSAGAVTANLVVDAVHNARAALASGKIAPLTHFAFAGGEGSTAAFGAAPGGRQRALVEIAESACAGFRFSSGASSSCGSSDIEIAFEDAASGRFSLTSSRGIFDLGVAYNGSGVNRNVQFGGQAAGMAGHTYAVQLDGGRIGLLTIRSIHNPHQKVATADKVFHGGASQRVAGKLGKTSGPAQTGDVSGTSETAVVATLELVYENP